MAAHPIRTLPAAPLPRPRAKVLRTAQPCDRTERTAAFQQAVREMGLSGRSVARLLCVDERIVRDLLHGRRAVTDDRVDSFPPRLRSAYEAALCGPLQLCLPF